ncbi:hypothetical protein K439DRAFT_1618258 [Ramaria rubella]|nr:hypothetical protein K439DRAFT_1618258 [Ramaria rubella]
MSLLMPNKAAGKHTYRASNETFGLRNFTLSGDAARAFHPQLTARTHQQEGNVMFDMDGMDICRQQAPEADSQGPSMLSFPHSQGLMVPTGVPLVGSSMLPPPDPSQGTSVAPPMLPSQAPSMSASEDPFQGPFIPPPMFPYSPPAGPWVQEWASSPGLVSPSDGSAPFSSNSPSVLTPPQSKKPPSIISKGKMSAQDTFPDAMQTTESKTSSKKRWCGGSAVIMEQAHQDLQNLCHTMLEVATMQKSAASSVTSVQQSAGAPIVNSFTSQLMGTSSSTKGPMSLQKDTSKKQSRAECAAAASEFMQLHETYLNVEDQMALMDMFQGSDLAVRMYLSILSPDLRRAWVLKWLGELHKKGSAGGQGSIFGF